MKILIVCSYKPQLQEGSVPFIREQVEALRAHGCECEYYHIKGKGMVGYLREVPKLCCAIRERKPDVVHAHFGLSCLVANLATRRVPVVSTYHGSDINNPKNRKFSKLAMWLSAWNIFVSKRNVEIAQPKKHWSLIPCGVNLPLSWDELKTQKVEQLTLNQWVEGVLDSKMKHMLFAGAFDNSVKDPELAKAAVALLDNVQLIELKGYTRNQVNALMYSCDALLMTSRTEGSPQVIKEAMACGCPIVSVDVGDVAERTEGVEGCFVVKSREPRDIAEAIEKAIAFSGKTNGHEHILAAGLTNELVAKRIIEIYKQIKR
jgi:glycosyltransferase involved in cell wall biosynthesis